VSDDDEGGLDARVDRLETGQSQIVARLDQLIGGKSSSAAGDDDPELPDGRPADVAEQVRAELARAEHERAEQQAKSDREAEHETMKQRLAKLTEVTPAPPQPRRQRAMWGKR
jgi:hypothetical protein